MELVLGGVAIPSADILQPPGHGVHQAHQVEDVVHPPMSASGELRYDFLHLFSNKKFS